MNSKTLKPILETLIASLAVFIIHKSVFFFFDYKSIESTFQYSLIYLYLFFLICSILIIAVLIKVNKIDINNVGNVYLLLTLVKIGIAYLVSRPILESLSKYVEIEKMNFFIIFALFLTIETVVTIRILNNKQ